MDSDEIYDDLEVPDDKNMEPKKKMMQEKIP